MFTDPAFLQVEHDYRGERLRAIWGRRRTPRAARSAQPRHSTQPARQADPAPCLERPAHRVVARAS